MSININSEASCRKAYLNYHCYGNSMGVTASEMGQIADVWKDKIASWQNTVSSDENVYEFDDSDYKNAKQTGKENAQEATGYEGGGKAGMITRGVTDAAAGGAGVASTYLGVNFIGKDASVKVANSLGNGTGKLLGKDVAKGDAAVSEASREKTGSWIVAAPLSMATGIRYQADKPNKEQKEACDELLNEMGNAQGMLSEAQDEMATMSEEIIALSDQANEQIEEANEQIEEEKSEYDMFKSTYETLKTKAESGEKLTEEEKALYKEVVKSMGESGEVINDTQEESGESKTEIYDEIATYQEGYDYAAETMGEVEGLTDFAESFDEATQTMCYVEGAAQGLNAASGTKAAAQAAKFAASGGWFTAWAWAFSAMGATGAATSGAGMLEQFNWAGEVGGEIAAREATQDFNAETNDVYSEEIDAYDGMMTGVDELTVEIPDEIEAPEDTALPTTNEQPVVNMPTKEDEENKKKSKQQ